MEKYLLWVLCLVVSPISINQENRKSLNFIITIDKEVVTTLANPSIVVKRDNKTLRKIDVCYYPGNLSMEYKDYNMIFSEQAPSLYLLFNYYQYSSNAHQEVYNYEIEIGKNWLEESFVILKMYNLNKKEYRKRLYPLSKDKNYTFDLETSSGQAIRIRKK